MQHWHFIWDPPLPGKENMEKDLELLQRAAAGEIPPVLRLYSWSPPAVSLGRNQHPERVVDGRACREMGIDVVKRPTGGRAVIHLGEITYSIVVGDNYPGLSSGVLESYHLISRGLLEGLRLLGIEADLALGEETGPGITPGSCFDTPAAYEVQVHGKKVIGSAQLRQRGALLQHGSILMELPLSYYQRLLKGKGREELVNKLADRAAGLYELGYRFTEKELALALKQGLSRALGAHFETGDEAEVKHSSR